MFRFWSELQKLRQNTQRYRQLQVQLQGILGTVGKSKKSIYEMSTDEFYDHIVTPDPDADSEAFFQFMFDYILTGYLDGTLKDVDLKRILGLDNPYQINRYVDKLVRNAKMQGTLLDELRKYQDSPEKADDLYRLILPDYAYDKQTSKLKIKNFEDLKNLVKDSQEEMQKQKKQIAAAQMYAEEKRRLEEYRKSALAASPEISQLISKDEFVSEDVTTEKDATVIYNELQKQKRGTVIRQAPAQEKHIQSLDLSALSPSELIAYKKALLEKLRNDLDSPSKETGGMNWKV